MPTPPPCAARAATTSGGGVERVGGSASSSTVTVVFPRQVHEPGRQTAGVPTIGRDFIQGQREPAAEVVGQAVGAADCSNSLSVSRTPSIALSP